jgi:hypothetical protein
MSLLSKVRLLLASASLGSLSEVQTLRPKLRPGELECESWPDPQGIHLGKKVQGTLVCHLSQGIPLLHPPASWDTDVKFAKSVLATAKCSINKWLQTRCQWLMPVILDTQKAEIIKIVVLSQAEQTVWETLSKIPNTKQIW